MRDFLQPGRSPVAGRDYAAAASHPLASAAALATLVRGGNAIDAAVTATFVLCVVEPQSTGIGGDAFALLSLRGATPPLGYNGSGRTPATLKPDGLGDAPLGRLAESSVHAVTVPGLIEALARLLDANAYTYLGCKGSQNFGKYCSEATEKALSDAAKVSDVAKRNELYTLAADTWMQDLPVIYLSHHKRFFGLDAGLEGFVAVPDGIIRVRGVSGGS